MARQAHTQRLGQAVHRVGSEHACAGATTGASCSLQPIQFGLVHLAPRDRTHSHEDVGEVHCPTIHAASQHWSAADDDCRQVEPGGRHQHAGDDLVAVEDKHQGIEGVSLSDDFHRIGNELPAGQGVSHARMVHGQPIAHTDSATFKRSAAGHANTGLDSIGDLAQPNVTGDRFAIGVDHTDERLAHLPVGTAQRPQQRAVRCSLRASLDSIALH